MYLFTGKALLEMILLYVRFIKKNVILMFKVRATLESACNGTTKLCLTRPGQFFCGYSVFSKAVYTLYGINMKKILFPYFLLTALSAMFSPHLPRFGAISGCYISVGWDTSASCESGRHLLMLFYPFWSCIVRQRSRPVNLRGLQRLTDSSRQTPTWAACCSQ